MDNIEKVKDLAKVAFLTAERYKMLAMQNVPTDYKEREKTALAFAVAEYEMVKAKRQLDLFIHGHGAVMLHDQP